MAISGHIMPLGGEFVKSKNPHGFLLIPLLKFFCSQLSSIPSIHTRENNESVVHNKEGFV